MTQLQRPRAWLSPRGRGRLWIILLLIVISLALGFRAVRTRRRARLHDFFAGWYSTKAANHRAAAQSAEEYGGETMLQVAREFRAQANAETERARYHRDLSDENWHALPRPWIIPPTEPPAPIVP